MAGEGSAGEGAVGEGKAGKGVMAPREKRQVWQKRDLRKEKLFLVSSNSSTNLASMSDNKSIADDKESDTM